MFIFSRRVNFVQQNILDKVQFLDQREEKNPLDHVKSYKRKNNGFRDIDWAITGKQFQCFLRDREFYLDIVNYISKSIRSLGSWSRGFLLSLRLLGVSRKRITDRTLSRACLSIVCSRDFTTGERYHSRDLKVSLSATTSTVECTFLALSWINITSTDYKEMIDARTRRFRQVS